MREVKIVDTAGLSSPTSRPAECRDLRYCRRCGALAVVTVENRSGGSVWDEYVECDECGQGGHVLRRPGDVVTTSTYLLEAALSTD